MSIDVTFTRLLTRGELPDSNGGLYNPSILPNGDLLVRREVDYTWQQPSYPTIVNPITKEFRTLTPVGFPEGERIEDCRAFARAGETLVSHVEYRCVNKRVVGAVRQRLSAIRGSKLTLADLWEPQSFRLQPIEKNWGLFEAPGGMLGMVYSLDPFVVFVRYHDGWGLLENRETMLAKFLGHTPRNSTHLIPFDGGWLGFWHYHRKPSVYVTGAYWMNGRFQFATATRELINGEWVTGDVYKPGVCYVSSADIQGDTVRLFYGEGDAHSGVATLAVDDLRRALRG